MNRFYNHALSAMVMVVLSLGISTHAQAQCPSINGLTTTATLCENENFQLTSDIQEELAILWSSDGDGSYNNGDTEDPIYIPGSQDIIDGTVTLTVTVTPMPDCPNQETIQQQVLLTLVPLPVPDAGANAAVCISGSYTLSGAIGGGAYTNFLWSETGEGYLTGINTLNPVYHADALDASPITITLTCQPDSPCTEPVSDEMILTVTGVPTIFAGQDHAVCEGSTYTFNAEVTGSNYSLITWATLGDGLFSNMNALRPVYTPGTSDISNGNVILTITASAQEPCINAVSDEMSLTIGAIPQVQAGADASICENSNVTLNGSATDYAPATVQWNTSGNGGFVDPNALNTSYTPGSQDIINGAVFLSLSVQGYPGCSGVHSDETTITIVRNPIAMAGNNINSCETDQVVLNGTAAHAAGLLWTTSGTGDFNDDTIEDPIYMPSDADVAFGSVQLTLTASPMTPCAIEAVSSLLITFTKEPTAFAGIDQTICAADNEVSFEGYSTNSDVSEWLTSGSGYFMPNNTSLNVNYIPSAEDILSGSVDISFRAYAMNPCAGFATSVSTLTIVPEPIVNAGDDKTINPGDNLNLTEATAFNYSSLQWETDGDGSFDNDQALNPVYNPGVADELDGSVVLTLEATGEGVCDIQIADQMTLTIRQAPTADIIESDYVCAGMDYTFDVADIVATDYSSVQWTSSGSGLMMDAETLTPTYIPSATDILAGQVILTVTVYSADYSMSASDAMILYISPLPTANAGVDLIICENQPTVILSGVSTHSSAVAWTTTDGHGIITNANTEEANYAIDAADLIQGVIHFTFNVTGEHGCSSTNVADEIQVSFESMPSGVFAGHDASVCSNGVYQNTDATAANYGSIIWTTSGDGSFIDNTLLNPVYTPGSNDKVVGSVQLTLTAIPMSPCSVQISDFLNLTIEPEPHGTAGIDLESCGTSGVSLSGAQAFDYSSVLWTTDGEGSFSNAFALNPVFNPTTADVTDGSVQLILTIHGNSPCNEPFVESLELILHETPVAYAGADVVICESESYTISDGSADHYSSINWSASGDGSFVGGDTETPEYFPGANDLLSGTVVLTMEVQPMSPCTSVASDQMTITIDPAPTADAGEDAEICEGDSYPLHGNATHYSTLSWSSNGSGTWLNPSTLTPTYIPGLSDIASGQVILTLTVQGSGGCAETIMAQMTLTIFQAPTANAGLDETICESAHTLNGSASNYSSLHWTTNGSGSFSNANIPTPVYTPSGDAGNSVILTLTVYPQEACASLPAAIDQLILEVEAEPTVFAGNDYTICETTPSYTLTGATANNYTTLLWSSSGTGNFSDNEVLNPVYTPSAADIANGGATLTLNGWNATCGNVSNSMVLTINKLPEVFAGENGYLCDGEASFTATTATASNFASVLWTTDGGGSFINNDIVNATYLAVPADYNKDHITITMTAYPDAPCAGSVSNSTKIYFQNNPTADVGIVSSPVICEDDEYSVTTATASFYSSVTWTSSGDGTFINQNSLFPVYSPGTNDRTTGSAVLTLIASPITPCGVSAISQFTLIMVSNPEVNAGLDQHICASEAISLASATASDYSIISWSTSGSGTFDEIGLVNPIYTPSAADVAVGFVTLTIHANSNTPCFTNVSDDMVLSITPEPTINAGEDAFLCGDGTDSYYIYDATATDYNTVGWTTSGDGFFDNATNIHPVYTLGMGDIAAGSVILELTAFSSTPCTGFVTDQLTITVNPMATVDVGEDAAICDSEVFTRTASVNDYGSLLWETSGSGTFNNTGVPQITYTPSNADLINGQVTLTLTVTGNQACTTYEIFDEMVLEFEASPQAQAGIDVAICEEGITISGASAQNYNTLSWSSSGSPGTLQNANTITPTYIPTALDIENGQVVLTLTATANTPCGEDATDELVIQIEANPIVNAGPDVNICENDSYTVIASNLMVENYASLYWSSLGDGVFINNGTLTPTYTPGAADIAAGEALITLTATPLVPCTGNVSDSFILNIELMPVVEAGANTTLCGAAIHTTADAFVENETALLWTTSGTGSFNDASLLHTQYTPGATDLDNGQVTLTLTATSGLACSDTESDQITLSFQQEPQAFAGNHASVCEGQTFIPSEATAEFYNQLIWSTSGNGTFINGNTINPTYTPGSADIASGSVRLTLTATPILPCAGEAISEMILTIEQAPEAFAGADGDVCEGETYTVTDALANHYSSVFWTTTGFGILSNASTLHPTYAPDINDVNVGFVTMTLTAQPLNSCTNPDVDELILTVSAMSVADAGPDQLICEGEELHITEASASHFVSVQWSTSGTGIFSNAQALNPVYYPGSSDIENGSVILTLTALSHSSCSSDALDQFTLTISKQATADAGLDDVVCQNGNYTLTGFAGGDYSIINWTHNGQGILQNAGTNTPTYQASIDDIGEITFTMHVAGLTPCGDASDQVVLTVQELPQVSLGSDVFSCRNGGYQVVGAIANQAASLTWTSTGTGSFSNTHVINPVYIPSTADLTAGSVLLTLTAVGITPCSTTASDSYILTFVDAPEVMAGPDFDVCENNLVQVTGAAASNFSALEWISSGSGSFVAGTESTLAPQYQFSDEDITAGFVTLTLIATGHAPCGEVSDEVYITVTELAEANAGNDATICESNTHTVSSASASHYSALNWSASGNGTLVGAGTLSPTYTPDAADIAAGQVVLTLTAYPLSPCEGAATSSMTIFINKEPSVFAGDDALLCSDSQITLADAVATDFDIITWSSNGTGTFTSTNALNPVYTPSVADYIAGLVVLQIAATAISPCIMEATDELILSLIQAPIVDAGGDGSICENESFTVSTATAQSYDSFIWSASGTGILANPTTLTPTYTPSAADIEAGSITLILTATSAAPCSETSSDQMIIGIHKLPVAQAGSDAEICFGETYLVTDATAENYATVQWSSTGSGTFANGFGLTPTYSPSASDYAAGSIQLILTAYPQAGCVSFVTDLMTLTLHDQVLANAGEDESICENQTALLNTAFASNYNSIIWTTNGDGSFDNTGSVHPVYTPGTADISTGIVLLTLTAQGEVFCNQMASDEMILIIHKSPVADAGPDLSVCEAGFTITQATAANYADLYWTTTGTGLLTNAASLTPGYTPSEADIALGSVSLTLNVNSEIPCSGSISSTVTVTISQEAEVFAGNNASICETGTYLITDATASHAASLQWSTSGDGYFVNGTSLNPEYHPGLNDKATGEVWLTLTATSLSPCSSEATDYLILNIFQQPVVNAGSDLDVCAGDLTIIDAQALNYESLNWTSGGTGTFTNGNTISPTYSPSEADIAIGSVILTLNADPEAPCIATVSDSRLIVFTESPVANAGSNMTICSSEILSITDATAAAYSNIEWSTTGDGVFSSPSNLVTNYTPGFTDIANGGVNLILTVQPQSPCVGEVTDIKILTINPAPIVDAGMDGGICEGESFTVTNASAAYQSSLLWTSGGTGSFSNENTISPTYTPSAYDINQGVVTLYVTAYPSGACSDAASDALQITIQSAPVAQVGEDVSICQPTYQITGATADNYDVLVWSTSGSGSFINNGTLLPTYIPSGSDVSAGYVLITLSAEAESPCAVEASDSFILSFSEAPTADAGADMVLCENQPYTVDDAFAANYSAVVWSHNGSGNLTNETTMNPVYYPSSEDVINGQVTLTLMATSVFPCTENISDYKLLTFEYAPTAVAGANGSICAGDIYSLSGNATHYNHLLWTTSGDGSFTNSAALNPNYIPGAADINAGSVVLTLTAYANSPCLEDAVSQILLTIVSSPIVSAGSDVNIPVGESFTPAEAFAENFDILFWETSGSGDFINTNTLTPTYTPSLTDYANGSVAFTLNASSNFPCDDIVSDGMLLTFTNNPTVNAGPDASICEEKYFVPSGVTATNYTTILWTTTGTGSIVNSQTLTPTYIPSASDIANGTVYLTITVQGIPPNNSTASDVLMLTIIKKPVADAGSDATICGSSILNIADAQVQNAASIQWTTSGTGFFNDDAIIHPQYTPSIADIALGEITLFLSASADSPCVGEVMDQMTLTIQQTPEVYAGSDIGICESGTVLTSSAMVTNGGSLFWMTSGSGTFSDPTILNTEYTPGTSDIANGFVTLILTAEGLYPCSDQATDEMVVTISDNPTVFAGSDANVCEGDMYTILNAAANNYSSILWATSGNGILQDETTLQPSYTHSADDFLNGSVTLTLTVTGNPDCPGAFTDQMIIYFQPSPTADAGSSATICELGSFIVTDAQVSNAASVLWTHNGTGTLINPHSLNPTYVASADDGDNSPVSLTLTAQGLGGCGQTNSDIALVYINRDPEVFAGNDASICHDGSVYAISDATANDYASIQWTHTGAGVLMNPTTVNPVYVPDIADFASGFVVFNMTAEPLSPCATSKSDNMILTMIENVTVDAGPDDAVCASGVYDLVSASAEDYTSVLWTTSGDGIFSNPQLINPGYTPGANDIINGSVTLTLTGQPLTPCSLVTDDQMLLTIIEEPVSEAGSDAVICASGSYLVYDANAQNYSTLSWTGSGDGSFNNPNTLNPEYFPGPTDLALGYVNLTLSVTGLSGCDFTVTDVMQITFIPSPEVNAGNDATICVGDAFAVAGSVALNYTSLLWSISGTGTFSSNTALHPIYTPSGLDQVNGSVVLTLTAQGSLLCSESVSDIMILTIQPEATAFAGADQTICMTDNVALNDAAANAASDIEWTSTGDGFFSAINIQNPVYSPGVNDIAAGNVILTMTVQSAPPCFGQMSDEIYIEFVPIPSAYAGEDVSICPGDSYAIVDATAADYSSIIWSTSGTGSFNNIHSLNPVYTPSVADIQSGMVSLTLEALGISPCDEVVTDSKIVSIHPMVEVNAGADGDVCALSPFTLSLATAQHYNSVLWTTDGTGTFNDPTLLNAIYQPSLSDLLIGQVELTLTGFGAEPCLDVATDAMTLSLIAEPLVFAGNDQIICEDEIVNLSSATASDYHTLHWSTNGNGTFSNAALLNAIYTPGSNDIMNGTVTLTLETTSNAPCIGVVSDQVQISINPSTEGYAGSNAIVCAGESYTIYDSYAQNYTQIQWATSGSGSFTDGNTLHPTYLPSPSDNLAGMVDLTMTVTGITPCSNSSYSMLLTLVPNPEVDAGPNSNTCEEPFILEHAVAVNYSSVLWTSSGTGTFTNPDIINAVYIPSHQDALNGSVVLTLTATSNLPCTNSQSDNLILSIAPLPEAFAGADDTICFAENFLLSEADAEFYTDVSWSTSGTGTFSSDFILNPVYTPSADDRNSGHITLTLSAISTGACGGLVSDEMELYILSESSVFAGNDAVVCESGNYYLFESMAANYQSLLWVSSGSGSFDNPNALHATYTPSLTDAANSFVTLTLNIQSDCNGNASDALQLSIQPHAMVYAGADQLVCQGDSIFMITATASDYSTVSWASTGTGWFIDNSVIQAIYVPGAQDIIDGAVTFTVTATSLNPCGGNSSDQMMANIIEGPEADAGADDSFCAHESYTVNDAVASGYDYIEWSTSGSGLLLNHNTLNPNYIPSDQDILIGTVELTLIAGKTSCNSETVDSKTLVILPAPTVDAGANAMICGQNPYDITGASATFYESFSWLSSGTGSFVNAGSLSPTYLPSAADVANGSVIITLEVFAEAPCAGSISDAFILSFVEEPIVDAGPDQDVCETEDVMLNATASEMSGVLWETSGDGHFANASSLSTLYMPGIADLANGFVNLQITAAGNGSCVSAVDNLNVLFTLAPAIDIDYGFSLCEGMSQLTFADFHNYASVLWSTTGTGTLLNPDTETPQYITSASDILAGWVTFTITAEPLIPCAEPVIKTVTLNIRTPQANAGPDVVACETESFLVVGSSAINFDSIVWTSTGNGVFDDNTAIHPIYTPGTVDQAAGQAILTLTVFKQSCQEVSDFMVLTLDPMPVVNAGTDAELCEGGIYNTNSASTQYTATVVWLSSGTGTFLDNTQLFTSYTPSITDIQNGSVVLTLVGTSDNACTNTVSDEMMLSFHEYPVANAGEDALVCESQGYHLETASAENYASVLWTTSGTGVFSDETVVNPVYYPSPADALAGSVTLTLWVDQLACGTVSDQMMLQVIQQPEVEAGPDVTVDFNSFVLLTGASVNHAASFAWYTSGTGIFSPDNTTLNATYEPSDYDKSLGQVILTLIAEGESPCFEVSDSLLVTLINDPNLDFSFSNSCEGLPVQFDIDETVTNTGALVSYFWDFGDGTTTNQYEPAHVFDVSGIYQVQLTVTDTVGHITSIVKLLEVYQLPAPFFGTTGTNCSGQAVQFTDNSNSPSGYITTWHWDFGDGQDSTINFPASPHVQHSYLLATNYNATLTVETNLGCINNYIRPVTVKASPIALFQWDSACMMQSTQFTDLSVENGGGDLISWHWDFDDPVSGSGNYSNLQNPQHHFTSPDTFGVQLVTENIQGCTDTIVQWVQADTLLIPDFMAENTCVESLSTFIADTTLLDIGEIASWWWDFGDGYTSSTPVSAQHLYEVEGVYEVTLTVLSIEGCEATISHMIEIYSLPFAQFDVSEPTCFNNPVLFSNYSTTQQGYITTWHWDFGDGNDTIIHHPDNPATAHLYASEGTYQASLSVTTSLGCEHTALQLVVVEPVPEVNFDYSAPCVGESVQFENLTQMAGSGDIINWQWNFGDPGSGVDNTSQLENPSHNYASPGAYIVSLMAEAANGCSSIFEDTISVNDSPVVDFEYEVNCLGEPVNFISSSFVDEAAIETYYWQFGDGGSSVQMDPVYTYYFEGTYDVQLTVTDTNGCTNQVAHEVLIEPLPVALFTYSMNTCSNEEVAFDDLSFSYAGEIIMWHWDFGDGTDTTITAPATGDIGHLYSNAGSYNVNLTVYTTENCHDDTSMVIEVLQKPSAFFTFEGHCLNDMVVFEDGSQTAGGTVINSWYWNFDDEESGTNNESTLPNPVHQFTVADTFNVQLVVGNTNGCTDTIIQQVPIATPPSVAIQMPDLSCQNVALLFEPDITVVDTIAVEIYYWNFGDGTNLVYEQKPWHIFVNPGSYEVVLTITDTSGCSNSASEIIVISETPTAVFASSMACPGAPTQFTDLSFTESGSPVVNWQWDFGDPYASGPDNQSALQHPAHIYTVAGTYSVKLIVETSYGCTDSVVNQVVVNPQPVAWFDYQLQNCDAGHVYFQDSSYSNNSLVVAWHWTFEPGYTSNVQNPEYFYQFHDSTYAVQLIAYDALGCSDTVLRQVHVPNDIIADFSTSATCIGDTTYFYQTLISPPVDSIVSVYWDFGDPESGTANTSTAFNPSHYYSQTGTYSITLVVTGLNNCSSTVIHPLQVHALPNAQFAYQMLSCDSTLLVFDQSTTIGNMAQWIWNWGDASVPDTVLAPGNPDISHFYGSTGLYRVSLRVSNNNGCFDTISHLVESRPCVDAEFVLQPDTLCTGYSLVFADSSQIRDHIERWTWDFGDQSGLVQYSHYKPDIAHIYSDTGAYMVRLSIIAYDGSQQLTDSDSLLVRINETPTAEFQHTEVCFGQSMLFNDASFSDVGDIVDWYWEFGDESVTGDFSTDQNTAWVYNQEGYHEVSLRVFNEFGCSDTLVRSVVTHSKPMAYIAHDTACLLSPVTFYNDNQNTSYPGTIVSWHWDFGVEGVRNDTSNAEMPVYMYVNEGVRTVTLMLTDEFGCSDTASSQVTTYPVPSAGFDYEENFEDMQGRFSFTNTSQAAVEYEWNFGSLPFRYDIEYHQEYENPVIVFEEDGLYEVELVAWNQFNCSDTMRVSDSLMFKGLFVPNALAPDNIVEEVREFKPVGINLKTYTLWIYDLKGNLMWESSELDDNGSPAEGWDGTFEDKPMPQGVYVWKADAVFKDGTVWTGDDVGASENSTGKPFGYLTLIR